MVVEVRRVDETRVQKMLLLKKKKKKKKKKNAQLKCRLDLTYHYLSL